MKVLFYGLLDPTLKKEYCKAELHATVRWYDVIVVAVEAVVMAEYAHLYNYCTEAMKRRIEENLKFKEEILGNPIELLKEIAKQCTNQ